MRLVVIIVAALMILGVVASGLILAQKGSTPTATAASTVYTASVTQEVSALPTRAPASKPILVKSMTLGAVLAKR
jgi:hypothetical protein